MTDETKTQPADLAATMLHEKQEVIYALMKENAQLRESSARVAEDNVTLISRAERDYTVRLELERERDEARAEIAKLRVEVDQLKVYGQGMTEEYKKLREERDAASAKRIVERDALASAMIRCSIATGHGDTIEDLIAELERNLIRIQSDFGRLRGQRDDMARIIERRREEKGGE